MMHNVEKVLAPGLVIFVVVEAFTVLAISNGPSYNSGTIVLVVECLKFLVSCAGVYNDPATVQSARKIQLAIQKRTLGKLARLGNSRAQINAALKQ